MTADFDTVDYFTDRAWWPTRIPTSRSCAASARCCASPHSACVAVTGYDEATEVYRDTDTFSSCNSVVGPFAAVPGAARGRRHQRDRSTRTATSCRCTSTWSRWTRPTTPASGRC